MIAHTVFFTNSLTISPSLPGKRHPGPHVKSQIFLMNSHDEPSSGEDTTKVGKPRWSDLVKRT